MTPRSRALVASFCLAALLLALVVPFSDGLVAAVLPGLLEVAGLERVGPAAASPEASPRAAPARAAAARGPPPIG